jgi:glycosyltransferase involved in cell wall biosynthesis
VNVVLLTAGDPDALTGGSLYHRRVSDRAARYGIRIEVRPIASREEALRSAAGADVVVLDSLVAGRVGTAFDAPVVASVHQRPGGLVGAWPARIVRAAQDLRAYRRADAIVVPSAFLHAGLVRAGVPAGRVFVVEPGSDPSRGAARPRIGKGRGDGAVRFVTVANVSSHKRPLDAIEAFARLDHVDATLSLIGDAADPRVSERVRARLARADVAGRARWLGPLAPDRVAAELAGSDLFVLPALGESYGIAVAEAMRAGLPAIVARSGNLPHLVRDGVDGRVVPPRDVRSLAAAMRQLALDRVTLEAMAAAAAAAAKRFPTWDDTAEGFLRVLAAVQSRADRSSVARRSAA